MVKTTPLDSEDPQRFDENLFNLSQIITLSLLNCLRLNTYDWSEAATRDVLCKNVFLEISQNSQENICCKVSFLIKLRA